MLEIIALIFLTKYIGKLARSKGFKPGKWKIYTVFLWIVFELFGFTVGMMFFDYKTNLFSVIMVGLMFAVTSFYIIKSKLQSFPDRNIEDEIDDIGSGV